jgi:hypothetical protein
MIVRQGCEATTSEVGVMGTMTRPGNVRSRQIMASFERCRQWQTMLGWCGRDKNHNQVGRCQGRGLRVMTQLTGG